MCTLDNYSSRHITLCPRNPRAVYGPITSRVCDSKKGRYVGFRLRYFTEALRTMWTDKSSAKSLAWREETIWCLCLKFMEPVVRKVW